MIENSKKNNKLIRIADCMLCTFVLFILFFTFFGKNVYEMGLPKVETEQVKRRGFKCTVEGPFGEVETERYQVAVPETAVYDNFIYVIQESEGRFYAVKTEVETGEISEDYIEVTHGATVSMQVIISSNKELTDGKEVVIIK